MNLIAAFDTIARISRRHGYGFHADWVEEQVKLNDSDPGSLWKALNGDEVWGGSGSLADISLSACSSLPEIEVRADELIWRNAFIELHECMRAKGISNDRADFWVSAFKSWNEQGIGI